MKKKILPLLLIIFIAIQIFRPEKNRSSTISANDITNHYTVPPNVQNILKRSCNDCHSNNTEYPWYSNVQPVSWWLQNHVNEGKNAINFSEFATYELRDQHHVLEELIEEVREDHMPLNSYLWIHKDARLDSSQKKLLIDWANAASAQIKIRMDIN